MFLFDKSPSVEKGQPAWQTEINDKIPQLSKEKFMNALNKACRAKYPIG